MNIVLDVSGAVSTLLQDEKKGTFKDYLSEADFIIAPELFVVELGNVMWKYVRFQNMSEPKARQVLVSGLDMIDEFVPDLTLIDEAVRLAIQTRHPVYDCLYLTLALKTGYSILSHDKKLKSLAHSLKIGVAQ
ncbi:MAG: type II toxin-antitoxin system VapC family toxin [Cyclobacteriaceae bacterium]